MRFRPNTEKIHLGKFPYRVSVPIKTYLDKNKEIMSYLSDSYGLGIVKHKTLIADLMAINSFKRDLKEEDARWFAKIKARNIRIYFRDKKDKFLFSLYLH